MRLKALSLLIAASLVSVSHANDEITRLLADLSFGDAVTVDESVAVSEEASQPIDAAVDVDKAVDVEEAADTEDEVELPEIKSDEQFSQLPEFSELVASGPGLQLPAFFR